MGIIYIYIFVEKTKMEQVVYSNTNYCIYEADEGCLMELSEFIVRENYKHHSMDAIDADIAIETNEVFNEEHHYIQNSKIFLARNTCGKLIGSIRVFKWNRKDILPIQKIFNINPLEYIGANRSYSYWHIGRFAIDSYTGISTVALFKQLMSLAIEPIVHDSNSFMIAEIDSKLLKVMNALGISTITIGKPMFYLASETIPVYSTKQGLSNFYNKYER